MTTPVSLSQGGGSLSKTEFRPQVFNLKKLTMLIVDGNHTEEAVDVRLRTRGIKECQMKSEIVVRLFLTDNNLTSFFAGYLPNLRVLDLSENELPSFEVMDLPNLEALDLSDNLLETIDLRNLPKLQSLFLSVNRLKSFETTNLPNLETLDLFENQLTSFDTSEFPNLRALDLDDNSLKFFEVTNLPKLEVLLLSRNSISSFVAKNTPKIQRIFMSDNQLTSFTVDELPDLLILHLSINSKLCILDLVLGQVPKLFKLDLGDTGIRFVDPSLCKFVSDLIKVRSHFLGIEKLLLPTFEIENHPVLEEIRENLTL